MLIPSNTWNNSQATSDYFTQIRYDKNGNIPNLLRNGYENAQLEMDDMIYQYGVIGGQASDRLERVIDQAPNFSGYEDIKDGSDYKYNKIGELIIDDGEGMNLQWRLADHKLKSIERLDQNSPNVEFIYNPLGVRVAKILKPRSGGVKLGQKEWKVTYYTYDANGQLMATYDSELYKDAKRTILDEQYIYGSKRVGVLKANQIVYDDKPIEVSTSPKKENILGKKRYELTNHLGNVLATITDRKIYNPTEQVYEPVITMKADYYAFGMLQPNRYEGTDESRHLFNGMEVDAEVSGDGNSYTTEFRQYDPRLGRWKSRDPLESHFPWQSPYVAFDNNPIYYKDPKGLAAEGGEEDPPAGEDENKKGDYMKDKNGDFILDKNGNKQQFTYEQTDIKSPKHQVTITVTREVETVEEDASVWYLPWTWGDINLKGNAKWSFGIEFIGAPGGDGEVSIAEKDAWTLKIYYDDVKDIMDLADALKKANNFKNDVKIPKDFNKKAKEKIMGAHKDYLKGKAKENKPALKRVGDGDTKQSIKNLHIFRDSITQRVVNSDGSKDVYRIQKDDYQYEGTNYWDEKAVKVK